MKPLKSSDELTEFDVKKLLEPQPCLQSLPSDELTEFDKDWLRLEDKYEIIEALLIAKFEKPIAKVGSVACMYKTDIPENMINLIYVVTQKIPALKDVMLGVSAILINDQPERKEQLQNYIKLVREFSQDSKGFITREEIEQMTKEMGKT